MVRNQNVKVSIRRQGCTVYCRHLNNVVVSTTFHFLPFPLIPLSPSLLSPSLPHPSPSLLLSPLPHLHTLSANSVRDATIDCGDLSPPTNGEVVLLNSSTGEGALAQYRCRAGYMVVGMEIRQCQMSGKWDGEAPMCIGE